MEQAADPTLYITPVHMAGAVGYQWDVDFNSPELSYDAARLQPS